MLECRMYSTTEMWKYLGVKNNTQAIKKLDRYRIVYFANGRGKDVVYNILEIRDPFRVYSVFDMGFDPNSDFKKLRNYLFFLLGEDECCWLPDEPMEAYMRSKGYSISRQTIAKYREHLELLEYFITGDFVYYKVYKDEEGNQCHCPVEKEEYSKAWRIYWDKRNNEGWNSEQAFAYMYTCFDGVPRKQAKLYQNQIKKKQLNYLMDLVAQSIYNEVSIWHTS